MELTEKEIYVREELAKLYPQLIINSKKTCGAAFDKHGLDLIAVAVEFFLNKPIDKQVEAFETGKAENFITFIMGTQLKSSSSKFYRDYRHHHIKQREFFPNFDYDKYSDDHVSHLHVFEDEPDEFLQCLQCELEKLPAYEQMVFRRLLINKEPASTLSKEYDIPYYHFKQTAIQVQNQLKNRCKHFI